MIACGKCSHQNPLGRVFCSSCGAKLELLAMTKETVEKKVAHWYATPLRILSRVFVVLLIVIFAASVAVLWPAPSNDGAVGTLMDSKPVEKALARARMKVAGTARPISLTEKQINAYLAQHKTTPLGFQSLNVKLTSDQLTLNAFIPFKKPNPLLPPAEVKSNQGFKAAATCTIVDGKLRVQSLQLGHLPIPGPLIPLLLTPSANALIEDRDWNTFLSSLVVNSVKTESLTITPKP